MNSFNLKFKSYVHIRRHSSYGIFKKDANTWQRFVYLYLNKLFP